jgi:hypothetical protein
VNSNKLKCEGLKSGTDRESFLPGWQQEVATGDIFVHAKPHIAVLTGRDSLNLIDQRSTTPPKLHHMNTLIGLIILILDIVAIISVLTGSGSTGHKVLWTLLILFLPLIGLILYYLIGRGAKGA